MSRPGSAAVTGLGLREKVAYGLGDMASNFFWQMFAIFIAKYYTDVFGLGAAAMGTMLLVTRIGDAFFDPFIGAVADRTRTRWGSFRPYLLFMALPLAVTAVLTFTVPSFTGPGRTVYAYVTLSLMMVAYSAINIPYSALLGVLSPEPADRTSAVVFRFVLAMVPVFIIVNTAIPMATHFGGSENSPAGWQGAMMVYSSIAVLLFLVTFLGTRERVAPAAQASFSLRHDLSDLAGNRPWLVLSGVGIAALTFSNLRSVVGIFYFENLVPGGRDLFGPVMTTAAGAFILGVIATGPLVRRFGRKRLYILSATATAIATASFCLVPPQNVPLVWTVNTLVSLVSAPTAPLIWAMYADTADWSAWKTGRRATGLVFSAASFSQKLGWALGGAGAGWLLGWFHYSAGAPVQDPATLQGIVWMMSLIPALMIACGAVALFFYPIDEATLQTMTRELRERAAAHGPG